MRVTPIAPAVPVQKDKPYKSVEESIQEVKEVSADVVVDITWVQGFDGFVGELVHGRGYGQGK
jgi:hypothetical protein